MNQPTFTLKKNQKYAGFSQPPANNELEIILWKSVIVTEEIEGIILRFITFHQ